MRIKFYLVPLIAGAIFMSSCKRNAVSLSFTNAKGEVPALGNLVFRFSHSLATDSMLNNWDSAAYISFEPAITGRFRWESPDELVFSPSAPLLPATEYTARVKSAVLKFSKYNSVSGGSNISFHTAPLTLEDTRVTWVGESSTSAVPQLDLVFNYPVKPDDVVKNTSLEMDGQKLSFTPVNLSVDNKVSLRISGLKAVDQTQEASLVIDKGIKPDKGNTASKEDMKGDVNIPSPFELTIAAVESEHDGTEGVVHITTSQQVDINELRPQVTVEPAAEFTLEPAENGFTLRSSKFDAEQAYALHITKGARGRIGGVLKDDYTGDIAFGELEAGISFNSSKAVYLSKNGAKNIDVQITNVAKVKVIISKIYENNLMMANRYGYEPQESTTEAEYASYDEGYETEYGRDYGSNAMLGDVIYEKEIDTRSLPKYGSSRLLNFGQFEDKLPDTKGIYHILIRSLEDYWVRDSRYISLSDLGLIAKAGEGRMAVFHNSIQTAKPLSGVSISVYSLNNQLIGTGSTDKDGLADISYTKKEYSGFKPGMIIAKTAEDFNYLPFSNTRVNMSRFDVGGKRNNLSGLDAFVYAERDVYRPGEKINFSVIIRDAKWNTPGDIPLKMKFLLPNGKEFKTIRKSINEEGSLEGSLEIPAAAITGSYTLEVYSSNDVLLTSTNFSVEEFMPDRIRVNVKLDKDFLRAGDSANLSLNAMNFFGSAAANRKFETEIQVSQKYFSAPGYEGWNFSLTNQKTFFDKELREGTTDAAGNAAIGYTVPSYYANSGLLQASFFTTVFDETGRPVSRGLKSDVFTQDVFFGIHDNGSWYYPLNQVVKFELAALNKDGKAASATARVELIKHEYRTVLTRSGTYFRYQSQQEDKMLSASNVSIGSGTVYTCVPKTPGDYELRVYQPGASAYVSRSFYSYGSYGAETTSFEVNREGNIDIELDKKSYTTGESVTALFKTPFNGNMLVTVETDHIISHEYVEVTNRSAKLNLKVNADHVPNAYITATLIKPHEVSSIPLTVAHGFKNIMVEEKGRKMEVSIVSQQSVRSKTHQKITVKASPGSYVTLSAVDNGILQVSDFKTPDPYAYFYQKKALQVNAFDMYPLLFAELRARMSSTGGDGADEFSANKRNSPLPNKRVKLVSYWGGIKKAGSNGEAVFEFDIPQFSGELRLMALSYKGKNFGAADKTMTVADPIVISTALPRFLSPGDTVSVPVTLTNTTAKSTSATATIAVEGPLKIAGAATQTVSLQANGEARAIFRIMADPSVNTAKVTVTINGLGEKYTDVTDITVRPPSTLQKMTGAGSITAGGKQTITMNTSDFMPASVNYSLVVSRSPVIELGDQLKYLVQYPYGCTEQTVSAAFPQLYFGDIAELLQQNKDQQKLNANNNIQEAIRKIKMRQLYNGAVTLWDGQDKEDWWATIYAAHFLLEARKAGFDVDNSFLGTMLNYINNRLRTKETIMYYYNRDQNKKIAPKEVAYGLYVLALAGRSNVPAMNYYKANASLLALDSRYLLAAAYATAGDRKSFASILPGAFSGEISVAQTGGSYYSDVRDEAIALNALLDVDPGNAQIGTMVKHVADKLKQRQWLSTQERAFAFLALGKHARSANQSTATAEISVNGKVIAKVDGGQWTGDAKALGGNKADITVKGSGRLYYFWQSEGMSVSGAYKEEDSYLKVRRHFYDRNGKAITGNTFKQNDLIVVGISLEKTYSGSVDNVVITDILPAGFEIENPRTKEIPGMDWIKDASTPDAMDVRDDRIHFFVNVTSGKQMYYYAVRAVSPGNYKMGPVNADAMYNGEYHSYNGAGIVRVVQ